jgi:hypothetical protein
VFDLAARVPMRWTLFELGQDRHALLRVWHHILGDGLSAGLLQKEISEAYARAWQGGFVERPPLTDRLRGLCDLAAERAAQLRHARMLSRGGRSGSRSCRISRSRRICGAPRRKAFAAESSRRRSTTPSATAMTALGRAHRASTFVTFLTVFAALMSRLSGDDDIPIGTPVAGRPLPELADIIGYFANTLVFRADLRGGVSTAALLARTRDQVRDMLAHSEVSFEELVEALRLPRDPTRNPLFQVAFALRERDAVDLHFPGARVRRVPAVVEHAKFDLTLSMTDGPRAWPRAGSSAPTFSSVRRSSGWRANSRRSRRRWCPPPTRR